MNIGNNLCIYDPRSDMYEDMREDDMPAPRAAGCPCDRCFYGRDPLAVEIIRLRAELQWYIDNEDGDTVTDTVTDRAKAALAARRE